MTQKNTGPEWCGVEDDYAQHADYLTEIEAAYSRARGKRSFISPMDWQLAQKWEDAKIPMHIVVRAMEDCAKNYRAAHRTGTINTLRYFDQAVQKQFEYWQQSQVGKSVEDQAWDELEQENAADRAIARCEDIVQRFAAARKTCDAGLRSAFKDVEDAVFAMILQIEGNGDTRETEAFLTALGNQFNHKLLSVTPPDLKAEVLAKFHRDFPNVSLSPELLDQLVLKHLYKSLDLVKLTLYEL